MFGLNQSTDTLAPKFGIVIGDRDVTENIGIYVKKVEYESADGMADVAKISCINPENLLSNVKIFQPGNELSLYYGYREPLQHVGRVVIFRQIPFYPENGTPTLEVTGYTKDSFMADNEPEKSKKRVYKDMRYSDAIDSIASEYKFNADIDLTPDKPHRFIQKAGVNDYAFVQGIANITGYTFWVDGDANGNWTLHFKDPNNLSEQDKTYTFKYSDGDLSSLLSFRPELLIKGAKTKITAVVKNPLNGRVIKTEVEEENNQSPEIDARFDPIEEVKGEYTTASDIKLFFDNFSFEVVSDKRFKDEEELRNWVSQWFRRQRENFILSEGKCIGLETLMSRQIHNISGTSPAYDGQYYFSKVRHIITDSSGYFCNFNCRKVVP